jgi:hypothetical protein
VTAPDRPAIDVLVEALEMNPKEHFACCRRPPSSACLTGGRAGHAFDRLRIVEGGNGPVGRAVNASHKWYTLGRWLSGDALLRAAIEDCAG